MKVGQRIPFNCVVFSFDFGFSEKDEEFDDLHREELLEEKELASKQENLALRSHVKLKDYPQAFSHFTHFDTSRKMLVVDIQGELEQATNLSPAVFRLTDPVIHHAQSGKPSKVAKGMQSMFGRTDMGKKGSLNFQFSSSLDNVVSN